MPWGAGETVRGDRGEDTSHYPSPESRPGSQPRLGPPTASWRGRRPRGGGSRGRGVGDWGARARLRARGKGWKLGWGPGPRA